MKLKRILLWYIFPLAFAFSSQAGNIPRVGIGLTGLTYYDQSFAMADVGRQSALKGVVNGADWTSLVPGAGADANGLPTQDFKLIFSATKIAAGTYKLFFNGSASVSAGGAGSVQNLNYAPDTNLTTGDLILESDASGNVWLDFRNTFRTPTSPAGSGLTNIHLWRPGYATDGSALFTVEFISAMQKFKTIRGMDLVNANGNPQEKWTDRIKPNYFGEVGIRGQSWELLIALANITDRDIWLNVPVKANDDYIIKLAQLVKFGSDGNTPYTTVQASPLYPPLKPGLHVYLEYGNEIWNYSGGFYGYGWALAFANANMSNTSHPIAFDGPVSDQYTARRRWIAYRSSTISLAFRSIFGDDAMMTTVRPIFSSQVGNANNYLSVGLMWAQSFYGKIRILPLNQRIFNTNEIWYGGGGAAYYESTINPLDSSTLSMDTYFSNLPTIDFQKNSIIDSVWTHAYGLKYIAYEGGPGPGGSAMGSAGHPEISPIYNADPRMKERMILAQDIWDKAGGNELVYYVYSHAAPWSFTNQLYPITVSDTSSVKVQAIDNINSTPRPKPTLGSAVPGTINLKSNSANVIGSNRADWAQNGTVYLLRLQEPLKIDNYILIPIYSAARKTYLISVNVPVPVTGSLSVNVNGIFGKTIHLTPNSNNTGSLSSKVLLNIPEGLSVIRIENPLCLSNCDIFVKDLIVKNIDISSILSLLD